MIAIMKMAWCIVKAHLKYWLNNSAQQRSYQGPHLTTPWHPIAMVKAIIAAMALAPEAPLWCRCARPDSTQIPHQHCPLPWVQGTLGFRDKHVRLQVIVVEGVPDVWERASIIGSEVVKACSDNSGQIESGRHAHAI